MCGGSGRPRRPQSAAVVEGGDWREVSLLHSRLEPGLEKQASKRASDDGSGDNASLSKGGRAILQPMSHSARQPASPPAEFPSQAKSRI